jgi:lipid-A-disaccharide synthase
MKTLHRYIARMLVIFPFEVDLYERAGVPVEFVGHPLVDLARPVRRREEWMTTAGLDPTRPLVALLPGSRPNEIRRILPVLARAVPLIAKDVPEAGFVVARAPSIDDRVFASIASASPHVAMMEQATDDVLAAADVVITASGTATVQTALHGRPMVIVYQLSPLSYAVLRHVVRLPRYGMVNLIAGRAVVPELIQDAFTPEHVAREAVSLLTDRTRAERVRADLAVVREALGGSGASIRAAAAVIRVADSARSR